MPAKHTAIGHGARRTGEKTMHLLHSQCTYPLAEFVVDPRTGKLAISTPEDGPVELAEPDIDGLIARIARLDPGQTATLRGRDIQVRRTQTGALVLRHGAASATIRQEGAACVAGMLGRARDILTGARTF